MNDIIFKVSRPATVLITDLQEEDINAIEASKLPAVTVKLLNAYKVLDEQFKVLLTAVSEQETVIPQTESSTVPMDTSNHTWNGTVGAKIGKTSRYHYVNFDRKKGRYKGSTSFSGKTIHIGTFKDEIECALMVDIFLDSTKDDGGRPRNRNDFPEVMEAYMMQQEVQHEK